MILALAMFDTNVCQRHSPRSCPHHEGCSLISPCSYIPPCIRSIRLLDSSRGLFYVATRLEVGQRASSRPCLTSHGFVRLWLCPIFEFERRQLRADSGILTVQSGLGLVFVPVAEYHLWESLDQSASVRLYMVSDL